MADDTYKDTILGQITGNGLITPEYSDDLLSIISKWDVSRFDSMIDDASWSTRFFYKGSALDLAGVFKEAMTSGERAHWQAEINRAVRDGYEIDNVFIRDAFSDTISGTYRRGGHYYVEGKRIY